MGMAALLGVLSRNQTQVTANGVGGKDAGADPKPMTSDEFIAWIVTSSLAG
jgi:hypothetical protein